MTDLETVAYDIEQLWIEGVDNEGIALELDIGVEVVEGWLTANGLRTEHA